MGDGNGTVIIDAGGTISTSRMRVFKTDAVVNDEPISVGGHTFLIDYNLDGNNVVGLTAIPEPASAALILSLCIIFALRFARKR